MRLQVSLVAVLAGFLTVAAPSQRILFTVQGSRPFDELGSVLRAAGDVNKDGIPDFVAGSLRGRYVRVFSGTQGRTIHTFRSNSLVEQFGRSASGAGDVDGDGYGDVLVGAPSRSGQGMTGAVDVFSGRTGLRLFESSVADGTRSFGIDVSAFRDVDGDGKDEFLVAASSSGGAHRFYVISGANGKFMRRVQVSVGSGVIRTMRLAHDVDKDGFDDILIGSSQYVQVWSGRSFAKLVELQPFYGEAFVAACGPGDVDGDAYADIVVLLNRQIVRAYSGRTGKPIYDSPLYSDSSYSLPSSPLAPAGDVDSDGRADYAVGLRAIPPWGVPAELRVMSGRSGTLLLSLKVFAPKSSFGRAIDLVEDVDQDGFADIAVADPEKVSLPRLRGHGEIHLLSGRILAGVTVLGTGCGGGPFLPVLGSTRPILGRTVRIVGERAPITRNSVLLMSGPVDEPMNLGFPGCDLYVDPSSLVVLPLKGQTNWTLSIPIPFLRSLTGRHFHLQALYDPTTGPLGFDLSNALRWRIGY